MTNKLEGLQKRAIKWILAEEDLSYPPDVYTRKCKEVGILPLHLKFDLNDLVFFHKIFYNLIPVGLPSYLTIFQGTSKLRRCHLDSCSVVSSI